MATRWLRRSSYQLQVLTSSIMILEADGHLTRVDAIKMNKQRMPNKGKFSLLAST
jgi:hypothetical protein